MALSDVATSSHSFSGQYPTGSSEETWTTGQTAAAAAFLSRSLFPFFFIVGARDETEMETEGADAAPLTHGTKTSRMMIESRAIRERQIDYDLQDERDFM